ncbi:MAG: TetR/AcrR family transcriptional regulator [Myxococcales bacterium]|nr:TetR/AcrR family transcriptional regulator [Myxococcales bacterium]MDH5566302.1 TetR/AcrR family transcriptional regulator [Myxococcales bacterium]
MSTRERIIDEAERLIALHGFEDLRLADIADAVGIRIPSIYGHFDSREAVYRAVVERYVEGMKERFPYDGSSDPTAALLDGVRDYVVFLVKRPAFPRLELRDMERPGGIPDVADLGGVTHEDLLAGPHVPMYARVQAILARGRALGQFREIGVIAFFRALGGTALASLTWPTQDLLLGDAPEAELEAVVAEIQDAMLRYVRAD